jgi:hypothetical protein
MSWNERSHMLWTHARGDTNQFLQTEIYAPGRVLSYRQGVAPDAYIKIQTQWSTGFTAFEYHVLVAVASDQSHPGLKAALQGVRTTLKPVLTATTERTWGRSHNLRGFHGGLDDNFYPIAHSADVPDVVGLHLLSPTLFTSYTSDPAPPANWIEF